MDVKQIKSQYEQNGYWVAQGVFSEQYCKTLIEEGIALGNKNNTGKATLMMPHRESDIFFEAMKQPDLIELLSYFLDGEICGLQSQFFFSPKGTTGFSKHQDNFFVGASPTRFVSAWTALVDCDASNGGLAVYPGSHKYGSLPVEQTTIDSSCDQDPNATKFATLLPEPIAPVTVEVPAGSIVFINGDLVHESLDNHSNGERFALLNTYIRRGSDFKPGNRAKRQEVTLN